MVNLLQTDRALDRISSKLSFYAVNPVNEQEEKKKFFKSDSYNPQFKYEPYRQNLTMLALELKSLKTDSTVLGKILDEKRNEYLNHIKLLQYRGNENFTKYSRKIYGEPDEELVRKAKKIMHYETGRPRGTLEAKEIIRKLKYAFIKYGFHWSVEEADMAALAAVKPTKKKLLIKKNARFSKNFIKRLVVHEIGTHIVRAENGERQPYKIFARGLPGYLTTEEGLAAFNEEQNDCLDNNTLKIYAGRVLAIQKALNSSFRATYNYLRKYFDEERAWRLTLRAKRGISDTSNPGGLTKDIVYLKGYIEIKKYVAKGGNIMNLYYGKVGLHNIDEIVKIPGLKDPRLLPMFRYFKYFVTHFEKLFKITFEHPLNPLSLLFKLFFNFKKQE